jgi:hypothetical protein
VVCNPTLASWASGGELRLLVEAPGHMSAGLKMGGTEGLYRSGGPAPKTINGEGGCHRFKREALAGPRDTVVLT